MAFLTPRGEGVRINSFVDDLTLIEAEGKVGAETGRQARDRAISSGKRSGKGWNGNAPSRLRRRHVDESWGEGGEIGLALIGTEAISI